MFEQHFRPRHIINRDIFMPLGYISMADINLAFVEDEYDKWMPDEIPPL